MAEIFWVGGKQGPGLAIVLRPRGDRRLYEDMRALRAGGIQTLVSLLEFDESRWLGIADEPEAAERAGIKFLPFPIRDATVPVDVAGFRAFVADLAERLKAGERLGIHCQGSIGRATVTGACTLVHLGWEPAAALMAIEAARGCPVPDTQEQLHWILAYKAAEEAETADQNESEQPEFQQVEPEQTEPEPTLSTVELGQSTGKPDPIAVEPGQKTVGPDLGTIKPDQGAIEPGRGIVEPDLGTAEESQAENPVSPAAGAEDSAADSAEVQAETATSGGAPEGGQEPERASTEAIAAESAVISTAEAEPVEAADLAGDETPSADEVGADTGGNSALAGEESTTTPAPDTASPEGTRKFALTRQKKKLRRRRQRW